MLAEVEPVDLDVTGRVARETEDSPLATYASLKHEDVFSDARPGSVLAHRHSLSRYFVPLVDVTALGDSEAGG